MMRDTKSSQISNLLMNTGSVISRGLMLGTSLIVLSACLAEQSRVQSEALMNNQTSQALSYAQAIQQYSSRSFNSFVSSLAWRQQTVEEDMLDPLNGSSSNYISSAYCKDETGQDYHLTWFNTNNADGNLSLKGLGSGSSGLVNARLNQMVNDSALAVARSVNQIEFAVGSTTLSSTCTSKIDIPINSAVIAYRLERPDPIAVITNKSIFKTEACPDGEDGTIVSTIDLLVTEDNELIVDGQSFDSEQEVLEATSLTWTENKNCHIRQANLNYQIDDTVRASALTLNASIAESDITAALEEHLQDIECRALKKHETDEESDQADGDQKELYSTCADGQDVSILERTNITEIGTLPPKTLTYGCMARPANGLSNITLDSNHIGIPSKYHGLSAELNASDYLSRGKIEVTKTTTQYRATIDRNGSIEEKIVNSVDLLGTSIQCRANNAIRIPCNAIFTRGFQSVTGNGPRYRAVATVDDWKDADSLQPEDEEFSPWEFEESSMQCNLIAQRIENLGCPPGESGIRTRTEQRTATITSPTQELNKAWDAWETTNFTDTCEAPWNEGDGDDDDNDPLVLDLDNDGITLKNATEGVMFDMDNDGVKELTGWVGENDGLLAIDRNGNGIIDNQSELFGIDRDFAAFDHLSTYDSNEDGIINSEDDVWSELIVWVDRNKDGISDEDEMYSMNQQNILEINLETEIEDKIIEGNEVTKSSTFTRLMENFEKIVAKVYEAFFDLFG